MDLYSKSNAAMDMQNFLPGASCLVEVTHINDPHSFFVRPNNISERVLKILEATGRPLPTEDVQLGKRIVYKSKMLSRYARGLIEFISIDEKTEKKTCTIFAMDYGARDIHVPVEDMLLPACDLTSFTVPLSIHCQLHLCEPKEETFDEDAIDTMKFYVGRHTGKITVVGRIADKLVVELRTVECPDDVSTMLALLHITTLLKGTNQMNRFHSSAATVLPKVITYKYKDVNVGDKLIVRVMSGNLISSFYVAEVSDHKYYNSSSNKHDFNDYCKRQKVQDVVAASADARCCGVRVQNGVFERGFVKKVIEPNTALVKLIDLGSDKIVKFEDIKCVDSKVYNQRSAAAIYCSSTKEQTWDNSLPVFLYPGYQFEIEIVKVGDGIDVPHQVNLAKTKYFY